MCSSGEETLFAGDGLALIAGKYRFRPTVVTSPATPGGSPWCSDGRWLLAYDIGNTAPDVSAADFD
jgi:hypothetical protein